LKKLEEQAAEQGIRTLWKGAKLEVESVVREAADKVLSDPSISAEKRHLRCIALGYMADVSDVRKGDRLLMLGVPCGAERGRQKGRVCQD